MKTRRVDSQLEKQILIAMIMSKEYLAQVIPVIDLDLLEQESFRQIAEWCTSYYNEYKEAPGNHIQTMYHAWEEEGEREQSQVEAIHDFLEHLSEIYDTAGDINVSYLLDQTSEFLSSRKLVRMNENIEYHLSKGEIAKAEEYVHGFRSVDLGKGAGIDLLNDKSVWKRAFEQGLEPLIKFSGDAGRFLNEALTQDALIGIQAPEKKGKTWWCVEFLMRALRNRKKVAIFEVGDLSESQIVLRLGVRLAGKPLRLWNNKDMDVMIPKKITKKWEDGKAVHRVESQLKELTAPIRRRHAMKAVRRFMKACGIPRKIPYLMGSIHPNSSINIQGITGILERWEVEKEFIPDVIIIDYADILAPEDSRKQGRDIVNDTWKALRRLSQERHCLVIAPTQADDAANEMTTQTRRNFSEDKRKYAHVTGMLGLNQTVEEKRMDVMRLNWLTLRESKFDEMKCLYVGQCFLLGRALTCSSL